MNLFTGCQVQFSRTDFGELSQECPVSRKQSEKYDGVEISLIKSILFSCWLFGSNWRGCRHTLALVFTVAPLSLVWLQLMCGRWVFPGAGGRGGRGPALNPGVQRALGCAGMQARPWSTLVRAARLNFQPFVKQGSLLFVESLVCVQAAGNGSDKNNCIFLCESGSLEWACGTDFLLF